MTFPPTAKPARSLWTLLACAAAARLFCLYIWPSHVFSVDLQSWGTVVTAMHAGFNPYQKYHLLNWPPLWMEILFVLGRLCDRFGWSLPACIVLFLTAADLVLIFSLWRLLRLLDLRNRAFRPVLWGLCLNPFMILLTVQQGNFDVIPTIFVLCFLYSLIQFRRGGEPIDWLLAAAFLGLGALAKTFPLLLIPILIGEARRLNPKIWLLGVLLCAAPAFLSLAPLFALDPHGIIEGVLLYRGVPGQSGISGFLSLLAGSASVHTYSAYFTAFLILLMLSSASILWLRPLHHDGDVILLTLLLLISIFLFGPGSAVQYWYWVAPFLVIGYLQSSDLARVILPAAIVISVTEIIAYAYQPAMGFFLYRWVQTHFNRAIYRWFSVDRHVFLFTLPMTAATLALWIAALRSLLAARKAPTP